MPKSSIVKGAPRRGGAARFPAPQPTAGGARSAFAAPAKGDYANGDRDMTKGRNKGGRPAAPRQDGPQYGGSGLSAQQYRHGEQSGGR